MKTTFRNAPSMSKVSELGVPEIATLLVSAAFWSWMMLAMLRPTFFLPLGNFDAGTELFPAYRAIAIAVCTATLLVYALRGTVVKILDLKFWEWLFLGISALGGLCAIAGSALTGIPGYIVEAIAAVMVGVSAPYFLLEWCRMYMRRGALSCAPYISGALAVSFTLSLIIMSIDAMICAIFVAFMPPLIGAALAGIRALSTYSSSPDGAAQFDQGEAYGAAAVFTAHGEEAQEPDEEDKTRFANQPKTFLVSAVLAGGAFGCVQGLLLDVVSEAHLVLLFYIAGAALLFLLANKKPVWLRGAVAAYMMLGVFSCLSPTSTNFGPFQPLPIQSIFIALGFMGYVVSMFVLSAHFAAQKSRRLVPIAAFNLLLFAVGAIGGFVTMELLVPTELLPALGLRQRTIAGFLMIVAAALITAASSTPLPLFESRKKAAETSTDATTLMQGPKDAAAAIRRAYDLTAREEEVLVLLLIGRSRPRIAEILCLSENTVNSHIHHIYRKAGVANFQELLDIIYTEEPQ